MSIKTSIQKLAGTFGADTVQLLTCSVDSVDVAKRLCIVTPANGSFQSFPAYLMAETDDGVLIVPSEGSTVKVIFSNLNSPFVAQYSEINEILIISGNQTYSLKNGLQQFNDGTYGGIPIVKDPADSNAGLLARLNKLEDVVKDLVTQYNSHTHLYSPGPGTPVPTATTTSQETGIVTNTTEVQISNPNILHGKDDPVP